MFTQIITDTLLIFLVTYAIVNILTHLLRVVNQIGTKRSNNLKFVLYAASTEEVECLVRTSATKSQSLGYDLVVIIDSNFFEAKNITEKLRLELPSLKVLDIKDDAFNQKFSDIFSKDA